MKITKLKRDREVYYSGKLVEISYTYVLNTGKEKGNEYIQFQKDKTFGWILTQRHMITQIEAELIVKLLKELNENN